VARSLVEATTLAATALAGVLIVASRATARLSVGVTRAPSGEALDVGRVGAMRAAGLGVNVHGPLPIAWDEILPVAPVSEHAADTRA
jgi:hypothetical protein